MQTIYAYPRIHGGFGIRNLVLVISTVTCANTVTRKIADKTGAVPVTHERGCMESKGSHDRTMAALLKTGTHPNVAGVLIVGLGCESVKAEELRDLIAVKGIPAHAVSIQQEGGSPEAEAAGISLVLALQGNTRQLQRVPCPISHLVVGVQCGGSDWTTALSGNSVIGAMTDLLIQAGGSILMSEVPGIPGCEHIVAARAVTPKAQTQILSMVAELRADFLKSHGQRIEEINPTPGNKAGGITTLLEKSMGNIKKMGSAPVQGVLPLGAEPPHAGLWLVDNRAHGPDPVNLTGFVMAGAHAAVFSTGRGSPVGSPAFPVIKLTGNPESFKAMRSIMDFNAGSVLVGESSIQEAGEQLYSLLLETVNGAPCKAEINENYEFSIPYGSGC